MDEVKEMEPSEAVPPTKVRMRYDGTKLANIMLSWFSL